MTEAGKKSTSRRELSRNENFENISPEVGEIDEVAVDELMKQNPDEMLGILADLTGATDPKLRELARRLAGRLMIDISQRGSRRNRGIGKMREMPYSPEGGDLDIDASIDALNEIRSRRSVDTSGLKVRGWTKPGTALCLLVDRSGSMGGKPLATSAVAAAAVAHRNPKDYSVLAFSSEVIVVKSQDALKASENVVNDVLTLRGHGTTDLAGSLLIAQQQLRRSNAGRKVALLLSDCRATVEGDVIAAASGIDELVVIAPQEDHDEAEVFAAQTGARLVLIDGPSDIPDAIRAALDD